MYKPRALTAQTVLTAKRATRATRASRAIKEIKATRETRDRTAAAPAGSMVRFGQKAIFTKRPACVTRFLNNFLRS